MKICLRLALGIFVLMAGCSREEVIIQIVRNPLVQFSSNSFSWKADSHSFLSPTQVVQYPANASQSGKMYTRYTLQATGRNDRGQRMQLNLSFDLSETKQLKGEYRPSYTTQRGLAAVQLFNLEQSSLAAYRLSQADTATARLQIQRFSESERLLSGTFQMTLVDERDTSQKIVISNGLLNDVRYNP